MNAQLHILFTSTGKQKVNGLLWRPVAVDKMHVFLSFLLVMGCEQTALYIHVLVP